MKLVVSVVTALLASVPLVPMRAPAWAGIDPVNVDVVVSTADGTLRAAQEVRNVVPTPGAVPDVTVGVDRPRQRLHGVGAALTESSAVLLAGLPAAERHALLEELFDPGQGGLSVLRVPIGASDFSLEHRSLADARGPGADPLANFSIERDRRWVIPVLREVLTIDPDIEIVASPWSAPGWMKNSASFLYGSLLPQEEETFARYLVRFVEAYRAAGIDIGWLTVQNEPAAVQLTYPSMVMSAAQQVRLLRDHLGPALAAAGLSTQVLAWDHNWCDAQPPGGCAGPAPAPFPLTVIDALAGTHPLGGTGFHCYGGDQATANDAAHRAAPALQLWLTECSGGTWQSDPFTDLATLVLTDRGHWSNATILWNLALDPHHGPHLGGCDTCRGVVTVDLDAGDWTPEVERDVLATAAWFAPAGSGALETATASTDLRASGTCSPAGRAAVTVLNRGPATTVTVAFGDLVVPVDLAVGSLTSIRAPEQITCTLADWPTPVRPDLTTTSTTAAPLQPQPAAEPARPVEGAPAYTG